MIKKITVILTSLLIVGLVLSGIGFLIGGAAPVTTGAVTTKDLALDDFNNVVIDVIAADITIETGDDFSVSYQLHNREKIEQAQVVDGTLYFTTGIDSTLGRTYNHNGTQYAVHVTVPKDVELNDLSLSTVDGDIQLDARTLDSVTLNSVSGSVALTDVTAQQADCEVVSGHITFANCSISKVSACGKSSNITMDGAFDEADINTISGDCNVSSTRIQDIQIKNVSGSISVVTPVSGISAKSYGKINYCGQNQGYEFNLPATDAHTMLTLNSTSGKIDIQTQNPD